MKLTRWRRAFAPSVLAIGVLAAGLVSANGAKAALIVDASVGGAAMSANYANFDDLALGAAGGASGGVNVSFTGSGQVVTGAAGGLYAAPFLSNSNGAPFGDATVSGADATTYLSTGNASATLSFSGMHHYLGLLWGSVDAYNSLEFFMGATSVGLLTGTDIVASANGNQGAMGTFYANIMSTLGFDRVVASSSDYAFEFDNVAFDNPAGAAVPEPAALGLLGLGLLGMGLRQRQTVRALAT